MPPSEYKGFFSPDPEIDGALRARTLAVVARIEEIDQETTTGDAFRKYVRMHLRSLREELTDG